MEYRFLLLFVTCMFCLFTLCAPSQKSAPSITNMPFGTTPDGIQADIYTLVNTNGLEAQITNFGATIVSLKVPDKTGKLDDVVLGFDNLKDYIEHRNFFGATVGRYGNRIANGKFTLDGVEYNLAANNGPNHLHGGIKGFDRVIWDAEIVNTTEGQALQLTYVSKDMEEGYPGNLTAVVTFSLTTDNGIKIEYEATTDKKTVVNLTNHSYFNLKNEGEILDHVVTINADKMIPVDEGLIPTGELQSVDGTPFDFRKPTPIGARINADDQQIRFGGGYDHSFVLNKESGSSLSLAARVSEPTTGRIMEVYTTEPGMQFYTGNFLNGSVTGKYGRVYEKRNAFCMETQHFPDSPNKPEFPSTVLEPGQKYSTVTIYKFSAE
ncbi:galactose mutarotase [candidate division KSB1 bacterium]|nr:galactose mutarotase [candidate division KSB1 bacterium]